MSAVDVVQRVRPAGRLARMLAAGVDACIAGCAVAVALMVGSQMSLAQFVARGTPDPSLTVEQQTAALAEALPALMPGYLLALAVMIAVPVVHALMLARQGTTPGKAMLGLSVRDVATGNLPGRGQALIREGLRFLHVVLMLPAIPGKPGVFAVALAAFDMSRHRLGQSWYDRAAKTIVVAPVIESAG